MIKHNKKRRLKKRHNSSLLLACSLALLPSFVEYSSDAKAGAEDLPDFTWEPQNSGTSGFHEKSKSSKKNTIAGSSGACLTYGAYGSDGNYEYHGEKGVSAYYDVTSGIFTVCDVQVNDKHYYATLQNENNIFKLTYIEEIAANLFNFNYRQIADFDLTSGILKVPYIATYNYRTLDGFYYTVALVLNKNLNFEIKELIKQKEFSLGVLGSGSMIFSSPLFSITGEWIQECSPFCSNLFIINSDDSSIILTANKSDYSDASNVIWYENNSRSSFRQSSSYELNLAPDEDFIGLSVTLDDKLCGGRTWLRPITGDIGKTGPGGGIIFAPGLEAQLKNANVGGRTNGVKYTSGELAHFYKWDEAKAVASSYGAGWHLPTKDELNLLCQQQSVVGGFDLDLKDVYVNDYYWSSTENSADKAWDQLFSNAAQGSAYKFIGSLVRAVRAF